MYIILYIYIYIIYIYTYIYIYIYIYHILLFVLSTHFIIINIAYISPVTMVSTNHFTSHYVIINEECSKSQTQIQFVNVFYVIFE